jgi:glucose/arabinose dehydrogenase
MRPHVYVRQAVLACALCAGMAACGSSSPAPATHSPAASASPSSAPATTPASSPATSPSASALSTPTQQKIAANWTAFFNPKVPVTSRIGLLQDGQALGPAVTALAKSSTASQTSAKVVAVAVTSPTMATVTYDILLAGKPVLTNQPGTAVLEGGTWKVGTASFCGILSLSGTKPLPAPCKAGG